MEYLFIQIQHFLFICIFNLNFTFPSSLPLNYYSDIFNPFLPYESYKCKTNGCKLYRLWGNFICVINYVNSSSVNFTLRERQ